MELQYHIREKMPENKPCLPAKGDHVTKQNGSRHIGQVEVQYSDYRDCENVIIVSPIMKLTLPGESKPLKTYV